LKFWVEGSGFRVEGLRFWVQGSCAGITRRDDRAIPGAGSRCLQGLGFRVWGLESRNVEFRVKDLVLIVYDLVF
jgi:hypothetical protein